jgi:glycosyltransferase involved in cell wall biosynthesis
VADATFLIVGDGPERPQLERLAAELGIDGATQFLGTRADIPRLLGAMDIFALTSRNEANPVSILEAMAAGRPVVAPNVGSIAESVADGVTGYLTDEGSADQVAGRLIELLENPALARSMGRAGRQTVVGRWSLDVMVGGYERLISEIYSTKCRGPQRASDAAAGQSANPVLGATQ